MSKPFVVYHASCADGFCSAWIARRFLRTKDDNGRPVESSVDYLPAHYGDPIPDVHGRRVYVLDFSYAAEQLLKLAECNESVLVLDHHESAEKNLAGVKHERLTVKFNKQRSGAGMTWEHFSGSGPVPWLVRYTEDRDLWRFALTESRAINANLRGYPFDFSEWDKLEGMAGSTAKWTQFIKEGEAILRVERLQVAEAVKHATEVEIAGYKVLAVNTTVHQSEVGAALAVDRPFGVTFTVGQKGVIVSLRSVPGEVNVSEVAQRFGGGGHARAAGFTLAHYDAKEVFAGVEKRV